MDRNQVWCLCEDLTVLLVAEEPTSTWRFLSVLEVVKFGAQRSLRVNHLQPQKPRAGPGNLGSFS